MVTKLLNVVGQEQEAGQFGSLVHPSWKCIMVINQKQGTSYYQTLMKMLLVLCSGNTQGLTIGRIQSKGGHFTCAKTTLKIFKMTRKEAKNTHFSETLRLYVTWYRCENYLQFIKHSLLQVTCRTYTQSSDTKLQNTCVSGKCPVMGYDTASSGNFWPLLAV
jgi:hypothetical protein